MDKSKLFSILGLALPGIALVVSIVTLITVMGVSKNVNSLVVPAEETAATAEDGTIPLSQTTNVDLEEAIIATLHSPNDANAILNVKITIGFRINKEAEDFEEVQTLMTENIGVIRDRLTTILKNKTIEEMEATDSDIALKQEMLEAIKKELDTEAIVEVYFKDYLTAK